jgi:serine/threonine protein kinase
LGVVHRDINPWNVLTVKANKSEGERGIRLADFGLAVQLQRGPEGDVLDLSGLQAHGSEPLDESALGSLYSAPELGSEQYGQSVDVFSLGMTLLALWSVPDIQHLGGAAQDALITTVEAVKNAASEAAPFPEELLVSLGSSGTCSALRRLILTMLAARASDRPVMSQVVESLEQIIPESIAHSTQCQDLREDDAAKSPLPPRRCCRFWRVAKR